MTGRGPLPVQAAVGTNTVPEIAVGCWLTSLDRYRICQAWLPAAGDVAGRHQMMSPGAPLGSGLGGVEKASPLGAESQWPAEAAAADVRIAAPAGVTASPVSDTASAAVPSSEQDRRIPDLRSLFIVASQRETFVPADDREATGE